MKPTTHAAGQKAHLTSGPSQGERASGEPPEAFCSEPGLSGAQPRGQTDPAAAIEAAAALIALAIYETEAPVIELGGVLTRLAAKLGDDSPEVRIERASLERDLAIGIENLQFHDRLVQKLTHVRNLLASLATHSLPACADQKSWDALMESIRSRFTSDSHRTLFNLLLPASGVPVSVPSLHANEGTIELF